MSDTVIRVENLGKKYTLSHQEDGGRRYKALRDVVTDSAKSVGQRFLGRGGKKNSNREDFWALKDVSFEVKQGDRVGIIGRNGAGKSTLLKILSRITEPTSGEVRIKGRVASLLEVGTGFHPELTGRENVFLNGAILGMNKTEIRKKFDEIVAFAEVEKFLDTPVKRYSSGMYVRLAFAVAAHLEPEILVVDEVLAVGDAAFQKKCLGKMEEVSKGGRTILFVSHNMATMQNLCSRAILLKSGEVISTGSPESTIQAYLNEGFYSTDWDNLLTIHQRKGKGDVRFSKLSFTNSIGNRTDSPKSGDQLVIRLCFASLAEEKQSKNCRIGLAITNISGGRIVLSTEMVCKDEVIIRHNDSIDFLIEKLPLSEGNYSLTLFIESNGIIQDWITDSLQFSVEAGDYYGTGKLCPTGHQGKSILVDFSVEQATYQCVGI